MSLSILQYTGSKKNDIKYFEKYIPDNIECIIEPFGGSGYLSLYMFSKNNKLKCIINDIDFNLINFFNQIKKDPDHIISEYNKLLLSYSNKNEYKKIIDEYKKNEGDDKKKAILYLFFNKCYYIHQGQYPDNFRKFFPIEKDKYKTFFNWINNTTFICGDYIEIYNLHKNNKKNFIFLDPPYLDSFNASYSSHKFNNNDNTKIYIEILELMKKNKKNYLLYIINSNGLTKYLYKDFIIAEYDKLYNNVKKNIDGTYERNKVIHLIISNKNKLLPKKETK